MRHDCYKAEHRAVESDTIKHAKCTLLLEYNAGVTYKLQRYCQDNKYCAVETNPTEQEEGSTTNRAAGEALTNIDRLTTIWTELKTAANLMLLSLFWIIIC